MANPGMTDLVSWWELGEASGNALDSHGSNDLTENGGTIASVAGKIGDARDLELADTERFDIASNSTLQMGSSVLMGMGCWVKLESKVNGYLLNKRGSGSGNTLEYWLQYVAASDRLQFSVSPDGTAASLVSVVANNFGALSIGTWYFVECGYDGTDIYISVNAGTRDTTAHSTDIYAGTEQFALGAYLNAGTPLEHLDGVVDEGFLYKKALSTSEIGWLFNSASGRAYSELVSLGRPVWFT